mmetsp:Transcript_69629/g.207472  ORF Transcript_69629/g.207472 Transcript_69629/m.207472 type:complete len:418 (-) Transcript_69629:113-1366(-)
MEVREGSHVTKLCGVNCLQELQRATSLDLVAHRGLRCQDAQRVLQGLVVNPPVDAPVRSDLHGVPQRETQGIGFDGLHIPRPHGGTSDGRGHALLLGRAVRRGEACRLAVVVGRRAGDGAEEHILLLLPVLEGAAFHDLGGGLDGNRGTTVTTDVTVGGRVEGLATARLGEEAARADGCPSGRMDHERRANRDGKVVGGGHLPTPGQDRLRGHVRGGQARRPLRRERDRRPLHVQAEGQAAGEHGEHVAHGLVAFVQLQSPLVRLAADVHASLGVAQVLPRLAHAGKRAIAALQDQPLVRVQLCRLLHRHVEELVVEQLDAVHEVAVAAVGLAHGQVIRVGIIEFAMVPPQEGNLPGVVRTGAGSTDPRVHVVGRCLMDAVAVDAGHLTPVERMVHGLVPGLRDLDLDLLRLQLLQV